MTDAEQLFKEGLALLPTWGAPEDPAATAQGLAMIRQAAQAGYVPAMVALANGRDRGAGFAWAVKAAQRGDASALQSALTNRDWPVEGPLGVLAAAQAGEPWAQLAVSRVYTMGMRYRDGTLVATLPLGFGWLPGVPDPDAEGHRLLEAAAEAGWPPALLYLAIALEQSDPPRALELAARANATWGDLADRDRAFGRSLYLRLLDRTEAPMATRLEAYGALAAAGDMAAQTWLAERYRRGDGVPKDLARARALYEPAADAGEVVACRELAKLLEKGGGGPADRARAQALYEEAAELGADRYSRKRLATAFGLSWYATGGPE